MPRFTAKFLLVILLCFCCIAWSAPQKELWPRWTINNPTSSAVIDFSAWQNFLNQHIKTNSAGINLINYKAVSTSAKQDLQQFITTLSAIPIDNYNRNQQLAYWLNLYNALTVKVILDHYPVNSVRDIKLSGFFSHGPWDAKLIKVEGVPLSLNDIEHRILRPIWANPLIHYGLNCATISSPNLQKTAFTGTNVNNLLNAAAKEYINNPRGVDIEKDNHLNVSSLYVWYENDFGGNDVGVIKHLEKYALPKLKKQLRGIIKIYADHYDWSLNETK